MPIFGFMIQPPFDVAARPARRRAFDDRRGHRRLLRVAAWLAFTADTLAARIKETIAGKKESDGWTV